MYSNNSQICQDLAEVDAEGVPLPPHNNMGVTQSPPTYPRVATEPRFDWYSASFTNGKPTNIEYFLRVFATAFPHYSHIVPQPKGGNGYSHTFAVFEHGTQRRVAVGYYGGKANTGWTFQATGHSSQEVADFIRREFNEHKVSRADIAEDYSYPGAFQELADLLLSLAHSRGLKTSTAGDWFPAPGKEPGARTLYIGSRQSAVFIRLYEKGKQDPDNYPADCVRLEIEVKPDKAQGKALLATTRPEDVFGASPVLREFSEVFRSRIAEKTAFSEPRRQLPWESTLQHMTHQYGPALDRLLEHCGGDVLAFGEAILRLRNGKALHAPDNEPDFNPPADLQLTEQLRFLFLDTPESTH